MGFGERERLQQLELRRIRKKRCPIVDPIPPRAPEPPRDPEVPEEPIVVVLEKPNPTPPKPGDPIPDAVGLEDPRRLPEPDFETLSELLPDK